MTVTAASFRAAFPAFASTTTYPDAEVDFWISMAVLLHSADRWGNLLDLGIMLFIAHNLTLEFNAKKAAAAGQNPGAIVAPLSSASVDKVSYSRSPGLVMNPAHGHWNLSVYGMRWKNLQLMVGAGPVYVGEPSPDELRGNFAWPGPYTP